MSTDIVQYQVDSSGNSQEVFQRGALQLYLAITLPMMLVTFGSWYGVYFYVDRKEKKKFVEKRERTRAWVKNAWGGERDFSGRLARAFSARRWFIYSSLHICGVRWSLTHTSELGTGAGRQLLKPRSTRQTLRYDSEPSWRGGQAWKFQISCWGTPEDRILDAMEHATLAVRLYTILALFSSKLIASLIEIRVGWCAAPGSSGYLCIVRNRLS